MRTNKLREAWAAGRGTVNGWCGIPSSFSAEIMAHQGWDSLTVDCQHGLIDYQTAVGMLQAISTTDVVPLVRVPWLEPGILMKMLDAGAYGIICPMINTPEEAEKFVSCCSYPPRGQRSFGPIRATIYAGADYPTKANDTVLKIAMVETQQAMDNLDGILSVEGLDGIYVGPADLANSMGKKPGFDPTDETVLGAIRTIVESARKHDVFAGIHCGMPAFGRRMIDDGFNFVTLMSDARFLTMQAAAMVNEFRGSEGKVGQTTGTY
ncbi:MAG: 2,4-dihydroxyhept-2-ene-1,7-dioic acid aldolase [Geminicoccaceae bacterium]|nr:2,4-dihydroxyhept-2-ene-1,7-dioic acid aldolase [Geminicoccaceae bacterium]